MTDRPFAPFLVLYLIAIALMTHYLWTRRSAGLGCSYMFQLVLFYATGASLRELPWCELHNRTVVLEGFAISAYGALAFAVGWCLRPMLIRAPMLRSVQQNPQIARLYLVAGLVCFFILKPTIGRFPTLSALAQCGTQLILASICLGAFVAWKQKRDQWKSLFKWVLPAMLLPVLTMLSQGFLGYGIISLSVVAIFCGTFIRPRWILVVAFVLAAYCGISFFVAYMATRSQLRAAVWGGSGYTERVSRLMKTFGRVTPFDIHDQEQLELFDARIDQSYLAGLAIQNLSNSGDYARGSTLINAALGLIPRVIWPDKPASGGSGGLVHNYTGLEFARGTSVGVGTVMELYINFATPGVVCGFFVLGFILCYVDEKAALSLQAGDWRHFILWFLFGTSFLNVGGSLVEVVSTAGASLVTAQIANSVLVIRARARKRRAANEARALQTA